MRLGWRRGDHPPAPDAEALGEEIAAYLGGRSLEWFTGRRVPPPPWVFLNPPTHRNEAEVVALAEQIPVDPRRGQRWDAVPGVVAAALVILSSRAETTLPGLQLDRLFPLEQALISGDVRVGAPSELVHLAVLALRTGRWHSPR